MARRGRDSWHSSSKDTPPGAALASYRRSTVRCTLAPFHSRPLGGARFESLEVAIENKSVVQASMSSFPLYPVLPVSLSGATGNRESQDTVSSQHSG
jgi:hypothetical protein